MNLLLKIIDNTWTLFGGFPGFLIALVILMAFVQFFIVKPLPFFDKLVRGIEKCLLAIKIPKFIVAMIMYLIVCIPVCVGLLVAVLVVDYLGLG